MKKQKKVSTREARRSSKTLPGVSKPDGTQPGEVQGNPARRHGQVVALVLLAGLIALSYAFIMPGTWAMDDQYIGAAGELKTLRDLVGFRRLTQLTFQLNPTFGIEGPAPYRWVNVVIHILCTFLVYFVTALLVRKGRDASGQVPRETSARWTGALLAAVVFGLHPIQTSAVSYVVQRMALLSSFFVLAAFLAFMRARTSGTATRAAAFYLAAGVCIGAGFFAKENAIVAIPLFLLWAFFFPRRDSAPGRWARPWPWLLGGLSLLGGGALLLASGSGTALRQLATIALDPLTPIPQTDWTATGVSWTPLQHLLTELNVLVMYLRGLALPVPGFFAFDRWGMEVASGLLSPPTTLFSLVVIATLVGGALYYRRRLPYLAFGVLWYFAAISLESFVSLGADLYFEHRNYLPLAGLAAGIFAQISVSVVRHMKTAAGPVLVVAGILALVLSGLTVTRNRVWNDSVSLWEDALAKEPRNLRAMLALGNTHLRHDDTGEAERYYLECTEKAYGMHQPHFVELCGSSLGMTLLNRGEIEEARRVLRNIQASLEGSGRAALLEAELLVMEGKSAAALAVLDKAFPKVAEKFDRALFQTIRGDALRGSNSHEKAVEAYSQALRIEPELAAAYYGRGMSNIALGRIDDALDDLAQAVDYDSNHLKARTTLADLVVVRTGDTAAALELLTSAPEHLRRVEEFYLTEGFVRLVAGQGLEAEQAFRKATDLGASRAEVTLGKARAYFLRGDMKKVQTTLEAVSSMGEASPEQRQMADRMLRSINENSP